MSSDNGIFDTPGPPSQAELDLEHEIGFVARWLDDAAVGAHCAHALSCCLLAIERHSSSRGELRPDVDDRVILLRKAARAHAGAIRYMAGCDRRLIDEGMAAVAALIVRWCESDEERAARRPDVHLDAKASARILRNLAHNICLSEEITSRKAKRLSETVRGIRESAERTA